MSKGYMSANLLQPEPTRLEESRAFIEDERAGLEPLELARRHPSSPSAWALAADAAWAEERVVESYAFARVGYHRGLDALRRAGWKGAGPIPYAHEGNRGFLRALVALERAAGAIGESAEVERIAGFLEDSDPEARDQIVGSSRQS